MSKVVLFRVRTQRSTFTSLFALWLSAVCAGGLAAGATAAAAEPDRVDFNRDIRPLISDRCFACHGPDAAQRKAELRLDVGEAARASVIVPGDAAASELVARISSNDPDYHMPPATTGKSLTPAQIELIKRWVDQGAMFEPHWSLRRLQSVAPPAVKKRGLGSQPDRCVCAGAVRSGRHRAGRGSRPRGARASAVARHDGPAADTGVDGRVRCR